jgi:hypothetical protein
MRRLRIAAKKHRERLARLSNRAAASLDTTASPVETDPRNSLETSADGAPLDRLA